MEQWLQLIVSILAGLAAAIPLVIKLVEYVRKSVREKNWAEVVKLVINLMTDVETKMEKGADKKEYVMAVLKSSADTINYDFTPEDYNKISTLIDDMCDMSKKVNKPKEIPKTIEK